MVLRMLLRILFVVFAAYFAVKTYLVGTPEEQIDWSVIMLYLAVSVVFSTGVVLYEWRFQRSIARELVAVVFGMAAGLIVSALIVVISVFFFLPAFRSFDGAFYCVQPYIPLIVAACCYVGITIVLQTKSDFRFLVPYIDFSQRGTQEGGLIIDTSALIDGRIADICETRLISVPVIIPDFVIRELQTLADSANRMKRLRGRRGLDMVSRLQKLDAARVAIRETDTPADSPVDPELVHLAREVNGRIVTNDFNLNKVGQIEGVTVVNMNELANALKPSVIPGEQLEIKIIRAGQEAGQGVGYLDDGTMVVVDGARDHIGQVLHTYVTGSIQTSAGRMIFARYASGDDPCTSP